MESEQFGNNVVFISSTEDCVMCIVGRILHASPRRKSTKEVLLGRASHRTLILFIENPELIPPVYQYSELFFNGLPENPTYS